MARACMVALVMAVTAGAFLHAANAASARIDTAAAALRTFSAVDLDGRRWSGADTGGRVLLLDFWATWCAPCLAELPRLRTLREKYSRSDFEILGVNLDAASRRDLVSWLNRQRIDWPQVHERGAYNGTLPRLFGVERLPSTLLVGRDGRVAGVDVRGERLEALIARLVGDDGIQTVRVR